MADKGKMTWTDWRGREHTREVNWVIDTRTHRGAPGHALLIIAANPHLSVSELKRLLRVLGVERSRNWLQKRRWLFQQPGTVNPDGIKPNADGRDDAALVLMRENPKKSLRDLSRLLAQHGIRRGKDWVRKNRCR